MKNAAANIINNIRHNKLLLYIIIFYCCIVCVLIFALLHIHNHKTKITGLTRVTSPLGDLGVDNPKDA